MGDKSSGWEREQSRRMTSKQLAGPKTRRRGKFSVKYTGAKCKPAAPSASPPKALTTLCWNRLSHFSVFARTGVSTGALSVLLTVVFVELIAGCQTP